ncbi:AfsR/SARP family transcriptional regulator [Nocardia goodfellowii]|nr:AfsR/SARP family transcriptional regulator [Nocardia goodfellowii]
MKYQLLGTLQIVAPDGSAGPALPRQVQALLVILLMQDNQTVSTAHLVDQLWNGRPPRRAHAALHVYISQLRKGLAGTDGTALVTRKPGYRLTTGTDDVDLRVFRELVQRGRTASRAGDREAAAGLLGAALRMWRGPVLPDLQDNAAISAYTAWLEELRTECVVLFVETQWDRDRAWTTIGLLREMVRQYPLHEIYYGQLMRVLHRSGRRAEALHTFTVARRVLATELGVEPCRELRDLYGRILLDKEPPQSLVIYSAARAMESSR